MYILHTAHDPHKLNYCIVNLSSHFKP